MMYVAVVKPHSMSDGSDRMTFPTLQQARDYLEVRSREPKKYGQYARFFWEIFGQHTEEEQFEKFHELVEAESNSSMTEQEYEDVKEGVELWIGFNWAYLRVEEGRAYDGKVWVIDNQSPPRWDVPSG